MEEPHSPRLSHHGRRWRQVKDGDISNPSPPPPSTPPALPLPFIIVLAVLLVHPVNAYVASISDVDGEINPTAFQAHIHSTINITATFSDDYLSLGLYISPTTNYTTASFMVVTFTTNPVGSGSNLIQNTWSFVDIDFALWASMTQGQAQYYLLLQCLRQDLTYDWYNGIPLQIVHDDPPQLDLVVEADNVQVGHQSA